MDNLVELIAEMRRLDEREAIRFHNGFRTRALSYRALYRSIAGVARFLDDQGVAKGDRLLLWGENRPEWVAVFWASLARGVEVVPIDFRSSGGLVDRIQELVQATWLVHGERVSTAGLTGTRLQRLSFERVGRMEADGLEPLRTSKDDVVQIVFTSGTTGEPKGVVHRHRHLCANLTPIQREIDRYKKLARPFQPIRILDLIPLSHLFGQSLGVFIPVLLEGSAVFMTELHPGAVLRAIRRERVSVLVGVPQLLKNLRHEVERRLPSAPVVEQREGLAGVLKSWWKYRALHRSLGWKFWALVVGGARLASMEENFWRRLGFVVVQGYGLTETSPVVTTNHPFHTRPGSLGKVVGNQEVKISPDGEILVRGDSVVSEYVGGPRTGNAMDTFVNSEGWLHTGDLGRIDEEGRLYFLGRKKDVIVTADGLNIYPQDVESALNRLPEVRESVVLAVTRDGREDVHAVLLLREPRSDVERMISRANEMLESHQRIRSWSVWPEEDFPRTASTLKIKRREVSNRLQAERSEAKVAPKAPTGLAEILAEMAGRKVSEVRSELRISEDLGLSSLEQVDLLSRIEEHYGVQIDEETLAETETVGALEKRLSLSAATETVVTGPSTPTESRQRALESVPRWSRSLPVRWLRTAIQQALFWPLLHHYIDLTIEGVENLQGVERPLIFAANHESHLDTPFLIAALPFPWRRFVAPAAGQEHFKAYFQPSRFRWTERANAGFQYLLACGLFNIYPLPHDVAGVRRALRFTGELLDAGFCPLVFPEGERTHDGKMMPFQPGIGLMAVRLGVPIVPVHLQGMYRIFSVHDRWPRTGAVRIRIGKPLRFGESEDYQSVTERIRKAIVALE